VRSRWVGTSPLVTIGLLAAVCSLVLLSLTFGNWIVDDAAISFTYAHNLAMSGELALFPGGERTEGFSNPSWVGILALLIRVGLFDPVLTPKIVGMVLQSVSLLLLFWIGRVLTPWLPSWAALMPPLLLASNVSFAVWGVSGLENAVYITLLLAATLRLLVELRWARSGWVSGLLFWAVAVTRPEGLAYGLITGAILLVRAVARDSTPPADAAVMPWRHALQYGAGFCLPLAIFFAGRWVVFHDLLPNPYFAKLGSGIGDQPRGGILEEGWEYLVAGVRAQIWQLLLPLVGLTVVAVRRVGVVLVVGWLAVATGFPVYAGGDWMMEFRFLSPFYPLLLLAALIGWGEIDRHVRPASRRGALALVGGAGVVVVLVSTVAGLARARDVRQEPTLGMSEPEGTARTVRRWADGVGLGHATLMMPDIGGSSYFGTRNDLEIVDLAGLADRVVARRGLGPQVWDYILELRRPDFLTLHGGWAIGSDLHRSHRFHERYHPVWEARGQHIDRAFAHRPELRSGAYVRRDLVAVPPARIRRPRSGPVVGPLRYRGCDPPRQDAAGHVVVTVYWEVRSRGTFPSLALAWRAGPATETHRRAFSLAGGCYRSEFAKVGDVVPTTVRLPWGPADKGDPLQITCLADGRAIALPVTPVGQFPRVDVEGFLAWADSRLGQGALRSCLDSLVNVRGMLPPARRGALEGLGRRLAERFGSRAERALTGPLTLADVPGIWHDAWRACAAWPPDPGHRMRFVHVGRLLDLARPERIAGPVFRTLRRDTLVAAVTITEAVLSRIEPDFPPDRLRYRELRDALGSFTLPALADTTVPLGGWGDPEPWGRWVLENPAMAYVAGDPEPSLLRIRAASWQSATGPQEVTAWLEGRPLGTFVVRGAPWKMADYELPLPVGVGHGLLRLEFARRYLDRHGSGVWRALPVARIEVIGKEQVRAGSRAAR
jgi:hypothetical protein